MLNPHHEPSLCHRFNTISLSATLQGLRSRKSNRPRANRHWLPAQTQHLPSSAVERDVTDLMLTIPD